MANDGTAERGRAEPIDVEFEPAERGYGRAPGGIGWGSAVVLALLSAGAGATGGAVAPRVPQLEGVLDKAVPNQTALHAQTLDTQQTTQLSAVDARLRSIETLLHTPLSQAANAGPVGADLGQRVVVLQSGLRDVEQQLQSMPSSAQVAELVRQVQQLQQDVPSIAAQAREAEQASRAAYAVAAAAEASRSSGPFVESYSSLQALMPQDENVVALAPLARVGAPTRVELRENFKTMDDDIIRAAREAQAGSGFWGRIQAELAQWIVIRPPSAGDTPDSVVDLAEQRLEADDLKGAITALNRLSGSAREAANPWLADAQRRLDIDTRLAAIRQEFARGSQT
ncbi:MAG: mitofilin family membrane protein [Pseudomonadota bacterium]